MLNDVVDVGVVVMVFVFDGVDEYVSLIVGVNDSVFVPLNVIVLDGVGLIVMLGVGVGEQLGVFVCVQVDVGVMVGVDVGLMDVDEENDGVNQFYIFLFTLFYWPSFQNFENIEIYIEIQFLKKKIVTIHIDLF